jgi:LysR family glycine cleavage system transcriptional activator
VAIYQGSGLPGVKHSPHLTYIRSFEAAARHLSFTAAAEELNYTQSAVSNHVRSLEEYIGRPLFLRHARSLTLTNLGEAYLPTVRHALMQIDAATESIVVGKQDKKVVISCPISLAENWLAGCLGRFHRQHPGIGITVHGTIWADVEPEVADIRLTVCHSDDAPPDARPIWTERLALVCAPDYRAAGRPVKAVQDLREAELIHILGRPFYWQSVIDRYGLDGLNLDGGTKSNTTSVALECAASGLGCVVAPRSVTDPYLARGLLIEPLDFDVESPWGYYISAADPSLKPAAKLLRNWLLGPENATS